MHVEFDRIFFSQPPLPRPGSRTPNPQRSCTSRAVAETEVSPSRADGGHALASAKNGDCPPARPIEPVRCAPRARAGGRARRGSPRPCHPQPRGLGGPAAARDFQSHTVAESREPARPIETTRREPLRVAENRPATQPLPPSGGATRATTMSIFESHRHKLPLGANTSSTAR